jgi:hypothetical protein
MKHTFAKEKSMKNSHKAPTAQKLARQRRQRIMFADFAIRMSGSRLVGLEYMELLIAHDALPVDGRGVRGWAANHYLGRAMTIINSTDRALVNARSELGPHVTTEKAIKQLRYCARKLRELQGTAGSRS